METEVGIEQEVTEGSPPANSNNIRIYRGHSSSRVYRSSTWPTCRGRVYNSQYRFHSSRPWINNSRGRFPFQNMNGNTQPGLYWNGNLQTRMQINYKDVPYRHFSGPCTSVPVYQATKPHIVPQRFLQSPVERYAHLPLSPDSMQPDVELVYRNPYGEVPPKRRCVNISEEDEEYHPEPVKRSYFRAIESVSRSNSGSFDDADFSDLSLSLEEECNGGSQELLNRSRSSRAKGLECPQKLYQYPTNPALPEGCVEDGESFLEMYVAAVTQYVVVGKQKTERMAAFGIWFSNENELNFAEILPEDRPQCLKAVLLSGSGKGIGFMKERGFSRVKINMESDFLVKNVANWTAKFMADACKGLELKNMENWDEYKYAVEITKLCQAFQGMIVKWSHVPGHQQGIQSAKEMARNILTSLSYKNEDFKL